MPALRTTHMVVRTASIISFAERAELHRRARPRAEARQESEAQARRDAIARMRDQWDRPTPPTFLGGDLLGGDYGDRLDLW